MDGLADFLDHLTGRVPHLNQFEVRVQRPSEREPFEDAPPDPDNGLDKDKHGH